MTDLLKSGKIPSLDGLRAVAVVLVLLAHAYKTAGFPQSEVFASLGKMGSIGVEVFFVISGFLITTLMLREQRTTGRIDIRAFYWRRGLRILPAYVALLLVVALLQGLGTASLAARDWIAAITYTVNFVRHPAWEIGHAWSLSIEEHFYLFWPLIMALPLANLGWRVSLGCVVVCPLLRWVVLLYFPDWTPMAELWTFTRLDSIAVGTLLSFLTWSEQSRGKLNALINHRSVSLVAFCVLACSLIASMYSAKFAVGIAYSLNAFCIAILLWVVVTNPRSLVGIVFNWKPVEYVGTISYSLYLWQQLFLQHDQVGVAVTFPQNIVFAAMAAVASYHLVERPFLRLKGGSNGPAAGTPESVRVEHPDAAATA
jgi:peptidoglycan/LPS O-acetylase OafA/YrhL